MHKRIIGVISAMVVLLITLATTASAAPYYYLVGHPMHFGSPNSADYCTGNYAVRGTSGMFVMTAGHCSKAADGTGATGAVVYGTSRRFGQIIRNDFRGDFYTTNSVDAALVKLDPGDDAYQIVVDPLTGRSPGDGRVKGYYANSALSEGFVIGKMGRKTGWTEGMITGWETVPFADGRDYLICTTAHSAPGDSGGPVWRHDHNGVMAIGMVIGSNASGGMCFKPIQNLLNRFGAWIPTFGPTLATNDSRSMTLAGDAGLVITKRTGPALRVLPTGGLGVRN
ncbi:hypothetical protein [Alloactinosynnema sp. L-07]|uniref:trypsin-like peptidase domain-containing protein n=1 Tax=Alloactinosynnema sp. L-07 TaxID=1653480 RepID=UPI00065EF57A|nr:trypsin-like peptidase domain-containing protein [Alloactinosynnema sp. L-07]CRK57030.1 hypothetical protein [Alloactinosynnema sp. L-07]